MELWAERERTRAAAEWGEAEALERSGSVVAVDHVRAESGGASESRPIQPGFFLFVVSHTYTEMKKWQNTVTKTVAYLNIYILLTKTDTTCLPNIGCMCSLVDTSHRKANPEAFREWEAEWRCWLLLVDPVFRPWDKMVHKTPSLSAPDAFGTEQPGAVLGPDFWCLL